LGFLWERIGADAGNLASLERRSYRAAIFATQAVAVLQVLPSLRFSRWALSNSSLLISNLGLCSLQAPDLCSESGTGSLSLIQSDKKQIITTQDQSLKNPLILQDYSLSDKLI